MKNAKKVKNAGKMTNGQFNNGKMAAGKQGKTKKWLSRKWILAIVASILVVANLVMGIVAICLTNSRPVIDETEVGEIVEEPEEPEEPEEEINTEDLVGEPEIADAATYQVAPNKPRYLSIPAIGLTNIPVTEFGVTSSNQLGSPTSTRVVGWFYRSAFPGKQGVSVMNAHGGDLGTGIFKNLPRASVGNEVIIEMGDGRKYTYVIREMVYKKLGDDANNYMSTALYSTVAGEPTLTLITCTGAWLRELRTYDQRLFVRATLK